MILPTAKWATRRGVKVKGTPGGEVMGIVSHLRTSGSGTRETVSRGVLRSTGAGVGRVGAAAGDGVGVQDVGSLVATGHCSFRRYKQREPEVSHEYS